MKIVCLNMYLVIHSQMHVFIVLGKTRTVSELTNGNPAQQMRLSGALWNVGRSWLHLLFILIGSVLQVCTVSLISIRVFRRNIFQIVRMNIRLSMKRLNHSIDDAFILFGDILYKVEVVFEILRNILPLRLINFVCTLYYRSNVFINCMFTCFS